MTRPDVTIGRHHEVTVRGRGSGMVDHYESLPLTTTEVLMESPSSPRHDQQTGEGVVSSTFLLCLPFHFLTCHKTKK